MFKDSCVTRLTPWSLHEEATAIPTHIFPAYIGSGECVVSLDASGAQGLNNRVQEAYYCWPHAGDLYTIRNGMIGDLLSEDDALPLGYFTWEMDLDGTRIDALNLPQHAAVWSRDVQIDEGRVVTRMRVENNLALEIAAWMPYGSSHVVFEITLQGFPYMGRPVGDARRVGFELGLRLQTRAGRPVYEAARWDGEERRLHVEMAGRARYCLDYRLDNSAGAPATFGDDRLGLRWETAVGAAPQHLVCVFTLGEDTPLSRPAAPAASAIAPALAAHRRDWHDYFAALADMEGIDAAESFLLHNSLYLLRSGMAFDKGITIGAPFFFPGCWKASTFWDSNQISDGLMKAGDREHVYQFVAFLHRTMRPAGKPFPWMFQYDGTSTLDEARDFAPLVMAAHATTAIKLYEYYRDPAALEQWVYPICRRVTAYAIEKLYRQEDGRWILGTPVSNDVVDEVPGEINQTHTAVWFLTVLAKTAEYARMLGRAAELDPRVEQILQGYSLEHDEDEYWHARGVRVGELASWVPFLLYPTEGMPFVDMDLFNRTRRRYDFQDLYMAHQGSYQPWTCFMQAASDMRRPAPEDAYAQVQEGLAHTFGPGLFSEIGPRQQTVGLPPYTSAHGAYIAAMFNLCVVDSIWEKRLAVFAWLPRAYAGRTLAVRDLRCAGGLLLNAAYRPGECRARIIGDLSGYELLLPVPPAVPADAVRVLVNGRPAEDWRVDRDGVMHLSLAEATGETEIVVR